MAPLHVSKRWVDRVATRKTSITLPEALLDQAEILAKALAISRNQVFQLALEQFLAQYQVDPPSPTPIIDGQRIIHQGDIYWVGPHEEIRHPYVVIQEDVLNHSRLATIVGCALTSNLHRASLPGNVLLDVGEANLPKPSVVEVSKVSAVEKSHLIEYIGSLSEQRIRQIMAGLRFLQTSFLPQP